MREKNCIGIFVVLVPFYFSLCFFYLKYDDVKLSFHAPLDG
uniref:Uncharacterized protein n=1 Tax=Setaria italica TaxID=4555 RepID=K3Z1L0_SETIT